MTDEDARATCVVGEWHGKMILACNGEKIGRLVDGEVDVETDESKFATVKEGSINRHLTFVSLTGVRAGPDDIQVPVSKELVRSAPDLDLHGEELSQSDESAFVPTSSRTTHHRTLGVAAGSRAADGRGRSTLGLGETQDPTKRRWGTAGARGDHLMGQGDEAVGAEISDEELEA